jgi:AMP deaminase
LHKSIEDITKGEIIEELQELYTDFQKCFDLRNKYMGVSCQLMGDNPNDSDDWINYPPTPPPSESYAYSSIVEGPGDVGKGFVLEEVPIPEACCYQFFMDNSGVFQVMYHYIHFTLFFLFLKLDIKTKFEKE